VDRSTGSRDAWRDGASVLILPSPVAPILSLIDRRNMRRERETPLRLLRASEIQTTTRGEVPASGTGLETRSIGDMPQSSVHDITMRVDGLGEFSPDRSAAPPPLRASKLCHNNSLQAKGRWGSMLALALAQAGTSCRECRANPAIHSAPSRARLNPPACFCGIADS